MNFYFYFFTLLISFPGFAKHNIDHRYQQKLYQIIQDKNLDENKKITQIFSDNFKYSLSLNPSSATYLGYDEYDDHWADLTAQKRKKIEKSLQDTLTVINKIQPRKLSKNNQLNYKLFKRQLLLDIEGEKYPSRYFVLTQMDGPQRNIPATIASMPVKTVKDYENIISRLADLPRYLKQARKLMAKGLGEQITPPQITLADVPRQIQSLIPEDPWQSPLLQSFKKIPSSISTKERNNLKARAINIYKSKVSPAWAKLLSFLKDDYIPGSRKQIALSKIKNGVNWYQYRVKFYTTTDMTPQQIHDLGLTEVKRIRQQMKALIKKTGFKGSFAQFLDFLRTDPQFFYSKAADLMREYRDIAKRIDGKLPQMFSMLPRLPYGVKEIPANEAKAQTTAYYQGGSLRAGRSGTFYANTYALNTRPKWEMIALTMHEAVPGHHLQISLAQEQQDLPDFRKNASVTAFVEGWALYAEQLGYAMDIYRTPYDKFGQLTYEMWRAVRLVVDTGMHSLGWTRQQAIDYFKANSSKSEHDIQVEIDRYIAWPGQALAYKIGQLTISRLRNKAEKVLGKKFDIRQFHKVVLQNGAIPLDVLEQKVNEWINNPS